MRIRKITFLIILLFVSFQVLQGKTTSKNKPEGTPSKDNDTALLDSSIVLDSFDALPDEDFGDVFSEKFDSLVSDWYIKSAYNYDSTEEVTLTPFCDNTLNPELKTQSLPDSVIIRRLTELNSIIDLPYNESVKKMIDFYSCKIRKKVQVMLGVADYYFPIFEQALDKYQLPLELKYMAIIESALNPKAVSRVGASGLWQFMYGTGKLYGLEVSSYVDERRDPIKSTEAAARYLRDLYNIYKDWHLVIAAYNCGPGTINRAIARCGGKHDYWSVYYRLPRETRGYVPAFISAAYIMNYFKQHDLIPSKPSFQITSDTVMVSDYLNLKQIASVLNIDIELLREINPMYKKDVIPAKKEKPYPIVLPVESIQRFIESEKEILAYNRNDFFPNNRIKEPEKIASKSSSASTPKVPSTEGKTKVYYTVKTDEVIGMVAAWFKVKPSEIKYWNNMRGNLIRSGQRLTIYVPNDEADYFKDFDNMSFNEKQHAIGKTTTQIIPGLKSSTEDSTYIYHVVRSGDNLWDIAKQYPGVSADDIKNLNNISNTRGLSPGQKLKIAKKS
ncbi:MAG TPA: transglycosylase SLT domain-containing protein [Prolixibacteraceae bacterium]|nr:transglycosylase SLT domain-containing protein [Prolixibacteraceae bacterium]